MITIIAGSRTYTDYEGLLTALASCPWTPTTVISGGARGVDRMGEQWAAEQKISLKIFTAHWDLFGKRAGYIRNEAMAGQAEALIALWDYQSKGTRNMIEIARRKGLKVFVWKV